MRTMNVLRPSQSQQITPVNESELSVRNSCNQKPLSNTGSIQISKQKIDASTLTDKVICKCDFDEIKKLKQKAHKSFMQVVEIQNLYKEEIEQLEAQYQQRQKTQLKKFMCKENMLQEKSRKIREHLEKEKEQKIVRARILDQQAFELQIENPFIIENVEEIKIDCIENMYIVNPNESSDTIQNLKDFIPEQKLCCKHKNLSEQADLIIKQFDKQKLQQNQELHRSEVEERLKKFIAETLMTIKNLIEIAVNNQEKYNLFNSQYLELQRRYAKLQVAMDAVQKESKFMAEHIRRISQDKIKLDKKFHNEQIQNKVLQEKINYLKKIIHDHDLDSKYFLNLDSKGDTQSNASHRKQRPSQVNSAPQVLQPEEAKQQQATIYFYAGAYHNRKTTHFIISKRK